MTVGEGVTGFQVEDGVVMEDCNSKPTALAGHDSTTSSFQTDTPKAGWKVSCPVKVTTLIAGSG